MQQIPTLRRFVPDTALPLFHAACGEHIAAIESATSGMTQNWPLTDRALVLAVPTLASDVARFHTAEGPSISELFQAHALDRMDEQLVSDLELRLRSNPEPAPPAPIPLRHAAGSNLPSSWHNSLTGLGLLGSSRLERQGAHDALRALQRAVTLLLSPSSQQRVIKAFTTLSATSRDKARFAEAELAAAAGCWLDLLKLPNDTLSERVALTLFLHLSRALASLRPTLADLAPAERKAFDALISTLHSISKESS